MYTRCQLKIKMALNQQGSSGDDYEFMEGPMIGEKIRELRKGRCINQGEFSQRIGVSQAFLSMIENNRRPLSLELIEKVSREFDVDRSFFVVPSEPPDLNKLYRELACLAKPQILLIGELVKQFISDKQGKKTNTHSAFFLRQADQRLGVFTQNNNSIEEPGSGVQEMLMNTEFS